MNWIRQLLSRRQMERDLSQEIEQHLHEKVEELVESGMSRPEARRAARREFGNVTLLEERGREVWRWSWVEDFFSDLRFAFRQLRRSPAFAAAGALTLALGVGANTAVFSVVHAVLLRPLPFPEPERLLSVSQRGDRGPSGPYEVSYPNFFDLRKENRVLDRLVSYRPTTFTLTGFVPPVQVRGEIVAWDLFSLLRVQPVLGRAFTANEEDPGARVVVVSYGLWKSRLGGDPGAVGQTISLNREAYVIAGVAPEGFHFPVGGEQVQVWTTLAIDGRSATVQPITRQRGARLVSLIGRLKDGVSMEQAQAGMDAIAASLAERYPGENRARPRMQLTPELEELIGGTRDPLWVLFGAVGLVLLLACANIASLILSRTAEREREFALRAAIGAGRARIFRQVVAESLTLSLIGCAGGVVTAGALLRVVAPLAGRSIPRIEQAVVDQRVLLFSLALALLVSVVCSLAPAARLRRVEGVRSNVPGSERLRSALMVSQIALGLVLVSGAGLLAASFLHLVGRDPGFQAERLLTFGVNLPHAEYPRARQLDFHSRLTEQLGSLPGARSAALAMPLPLTGSGMTISFQIEQEPAPPHARPSSNVAIVSPEYFRTVGIPLVQGREFTERDDAAAPPVLIVNRAFAEKFFPGQEAVGKRIEPGATADAGGARRREIVGVVGNARQAPLAAHPEPIYYFPYRQLPWCCPSVIVRASGSPAALESAVRGVVASLDRMLAVSEVRTADQILSAGVTQPRFQMLLLGSFAVLGLFLTAIGLYGVLNYAVVRRTREIGVRIALGANRGTILSMVLRKALSLVAAGVLIGMAGVLGSGRLLEKMLYGVGPRNPALLALAVLVVGAVAAVAAYLPARRASSIDPMEALRSE